MPRQYPTHFQLKIVDRMFARQPVIFLAQRTQVPELPLHRWRHQTQIDAGLIDGVNSVESAARQLSSSRGSP